MREGSDDSHPFSLKAARDLVQSIPPPLHNELQFEIDMFQSRLELLALRSRSPGSFPEVDRQRICENVYEFLRDDLIYFLQKSLARGGTLSDKMAERGQLRRALLNALREFRADTIFSVRDDHSRLSIPEKWYQHLSQTVLLNEEKIIHYLDIYRHQIYSLLNNVSLDHSDFRSIIRRMARDPGGEGHERMTFEEMYRAEMILRDEIQFTLLREYSRGRRLDYLIGKEYIVKITDEFIHILHQEFESQLQHSLSEQKRIVANLAAEKTNLDSELKAASHQQSRLLQSKLPADDARIRFHVWYQPLMALGGDFYRIFPIDEHRYGLFLLDIAGHGLGAAMYMNTVANAFEDMRKYLGRAGRFMRHFNAALYGRLGDNFLTAFYGIINLRKKRIEYASAGHTRSLLFSLAIGKARVRFLKPNGKVLGIFKKVEYPDTEVPLREDSRLIAFTDGISETFNARSELFSEKRLVETCRRGRSMSQEDLARQVEKDLLSFSGALRPEDDRTMLQADIFLRNSR
ncbi:MAG: serine/threonine-protein phosphatase [Spirochaetales bacterium]|nr:serine/threonine-protein phosphatase [Spirochaetales bacterium]